MDEGVDVPESREDLLQFNEEVQIPRSIKYCKRRGCLSLEFLGGRGH